MKNFYSQGWFSKVAITGIIGNLFIITVFAPEINSTSVRVTSHNVVYFAPNIPVTQTVYNTGVEFIYLTEPANSNISKVPDSSQNIIPGFSASFGFNLDKLRLGKCIYFAEYISHKSLRQVCLLLDIPPPVNC